MAFSDAFGEHIVIPGQHAVLMLSSSSYLTRLFTLISPHEMLEDPVFHETELADVSPQFAATRVNDCDGGPTYFELPDGRQVVVDDGGPMPQLDGMPAAERIERVPMLGPAQVELDNQGLIDELIDEYNAGLIRGPQPNCSIARPRLEGLLAMFGIAWGSRRPRC